MQEETRESKSALPRFFTLEMFMFTVTALSGLVLLWSIAVPYRNVAIMVCAGVVFTLSIVVVIRLIMDPDSVRARQSDSMLKLASQTLTCMNDGMDYKAAQKICGLLLPSTAAIAVAITDKKQILGYAGFEEAQNLPGSIIRTHATHATLADGKLRILFTPEDIGFPSESSNIKAAIIVPLAVGRNVEGTLKFYYRRAKHISETQKSIAEGFGKLLSTQMAASALEEQTQLATRMELKMLQSQINPHFLFNTINTMASLTRTDPDKARILLREFATFYRGALEHASDLIPLAREVEQTVRYLSLEQARFGEDRLRVDVDISDEVKALMVPAFMIQPLVENSIKHAFPAEGQLVISISGEIQAADVFLYVADNGLGMTEEALENIMDPSSQTGLGIAVKNVNDRILGYFGEESFMKYASELGKGTRVTLYLKGCAENQPS